ncbi:MAG: DUF4153 domain-containing protein [Sarcina sp.]
MSKNVIFIKTKDGFLIDNENKFLEFNGERNNEKVKSFIKDEIGIEKDNISIVDNKELNFYGEKINVIFTKVMYEGELKNEFREFNTLVDNLESLYIEIAYDYTLFYEGRGNVEIRTREKLGEKEKKVKKIDLIFSIVMGLIFGISLFYGADGINTVGIWTTFASVVITAYLMTVKKGKVKNIFGGIVVGVGVLLSITFSIFTNDMLRALNLLIVPTFILGGMRLLFMNKIEFTFWGFIKKILYLVVINPLINSQKIYILKLFNEENVEGKKDKNKGLLKDIFIGVGISIPALLILGIILGSANSYFADLMSNVINVLFDFHLGNFQNFLFGIVATVIVFVYVQIFLNSMNVQFEGGEKRKDIHPNRKTVRFNVRILNTVLVMINGLYLVFVLSTMRHQTDVYSEIAREGFFQLIFVVLLNIIIIMSFEKKTNNKMFSKILFATMTILSGFMGVSSVISLGNYIDVYGLTSLRFISIIFAALLMILLLMIFINIFKKFKMWNYALIMFMIAYVIVNYINMDAYIVKFNVNKYEKTHNERYLDKYYLRTLSKDAKFQIADAVKEGYLPESILNYYISNENYHNIPQNNKWFEYNYYADSQI